MITFWQYLKEIHDSEIKKISGTLNNFEIGNYNFDAEHIFGIKKRISFKIFEKFNNDIESFINLLKKNGINITIDQLIENRIYIQEEKLGIDNKVYIKNRPFTISNYIRKFFYEKENSEKEKQEYQLKVIMDKLISVMDLIKKLDYQNDYSVIVSRHPIDILRMSDHLDDHGNKIKSCHSYGGTHYDCAISEAKIGTIIAYAVKTKDLENVDLQANEIFRDKDRGVIGTIKDLDQEQKGIYPVERLKFRRFYHHKNKITIFIPELKTYSLRDEKENPIIKVPGFRDAVVKWAKNIQKSIIAKIDPEDDYDGFHLRGAHYQDNQAYELWNDFFGTNVQEEKIAIDYDEDSIESVNSQVRMVTYRRNYRYIKLNYKERDIYSYLEAELKLIFDEESFLRIPTKEELNQKSPNSLSNELKSKNDFFDLSSFDINNNIDQYDYDDSKKIVINVNIIGPDTEKEKDIYKFYDFVESIENVNDNYNYLFYLANNWLYKNNYINYNISDYSQFKKIKIINNQAIRLLENNLGQFRYIQLFVKTISVYCYIYSEINMFFDSFFFKKMPTQEELLQESPNSLLNYIKSKNEIFDFSKFNCSIKTKEVNNKLKITIKSIGPNSKDQTDIIKFQEFVTNNKEIDRNFNEFLSTVYHYFYENNYIKNDVQNYIENKKLNHFKIKKISKEEFFNFYKNSNHYDKIQYKINFDYYEVSTEWIEIGNLSKLNLYQINSIFKKYKDQIYCRENYFPVLNNIYVSDYNYEYLLMFKFNSPIINNNIFTEKDKLNFKFNFLFQLPSSDMRDQLKEINAIEKIDQDFEQYITIMKDWFENLNMKKIV